MSLKTCDFAHTHIYIYIMFKIHMSDFFGLFIYVNSLTVRLVMSIVKVIVSSKKFKERPVRGGVVFVGDETKSISRFSTL